MPVPGTQLASILSAKIIALGATPVITDLQADVAENLLWQQLLSLLAGDAELANLFAFENDLGTSIVVNTLALTNVPIINPVVIDGNNWPVGAVIEVCLTGQMVNGSGVGSGHAVGISLAGTDGLLFPAVNLAPGEVVNFSGCIRFIRRDAKFIGGLGGCLCVNTKVASTKVFAPTPPLPFVPNLDLLPQVQMDLADPAVSTIIFSETVKVSAFSSVQIVTP